MNSSEQIIKGVIISHSFGDYLQQHLREVMENPFLNEFSGALNLKSINVNGQKARFTSIKMLSISEARIDDKLNGTMDKFKTFICNEQPDVIVCDLGSFDICGWCPPDDGENPTAWSREYIDSLINKLVGFHREMMCCTNVTAIGYCKITNRRSLDGISHDTFQRRRDRFNCELEKRELSEINFVAAKHSRSSLRSLHPTFTQDDIHFTEFEGLRHYAQSIRNVFHILARRFRPKNS